MNNKLINKCYKESKKLLINNSTRFGALASSLSKKAKNRNYLSIFGRDASICSMGMAVSGDKRLIDTAKKSLVTLAEFQADNGQIPNYIKPEKKQVDFWYIGCIDATLWWLIAVKFFDNNVKDATLEKKYKKNIQKAISWLFAHEHPVFHLVSQNEVSDWADIFPRSGFVLYANALWYWVKILYNLKWKSETKKYFNYLFDPWEKISKEIARKNRRFLKLRSYIKNDRFNKDLYVSFVNYKFWGKDQDVYGNLIACLSGLTDSIKKKKIINYLIKQKANYPYPVKTVLRPFTKKSKFWRDYMEIHNQNFPYQYHNGGIWPYVGGFWVMALAESGKKELAESELEKLAEANKINNWQFNEWFHGQTGKPMGMAGQSWNAGMYLLAYNSLINKFK
ncbi:glycoside hydrolase [Candidatus Falkowbacteria bacterium CG_4_9_14_3_um_filter_36_9]|nr:MAG: glycoside hydrolase [Candidatus Falkowbacteria bacterium CG_4_9_14_3_um_filter_36_9]